jgi:L-fuculose-phosphate aldolase
MKHTIEAPASSANTFLKERQAVVDACIQLADMGYLAGIGGNVALRLDGGRAFAVTPSAADYYSMGPTDICVLDLESLAVLAGDRQPSVESGMHAAILRFRPDLTASVHTHQPIASAVALLATDLPVQGEEARSALGSMVRLTSYGPSGTGFLVRALQKILRSDLNAYLLRNHGIVCGGSTMKQAIRNVELIEQEAARFVRETIADFEQRNPKQAAALTGPGTGAVGALIEEALKQK